MNPLAHPIASVAQVSPQHRIRFIAGVAVFVVLFHLTFQPFQFRFYGWGEKWLVSLGFGLITAVILGIHAIWLPKYFPAWFQADRWRGRHELLWLGSMLWWVALGNVAIKSLAGFYDGSWLRLTHGLLATLAIGVIPLSMYGLYQWRKSHQTSEAPLARVILKAERGADRIGLNPAHIGCLNAQGNYVEVWYLSEGNWRQHRLRTRLSSLKKELADQSALQQCHRSCLVNPEWMAELTGNAHGGQVRLVDSEAWFPVSRTYFRTLSESWAS